jgi:serine/threonine protein kinase
MKQTRDQTRTLEDIVEQFTAEIRAGQSPSVQQFVEQNPTHAEELPDLLSSVAMIEGLKNYSPNSSVPDQQFIDIDVPDFLGEYRIVREIGRGGMGIVFEAVHETLGRRVAIKVMTVGLISNTKHLERFHREAISAASLHHTNIASVFGAGEDNGLHFYVMEFIDGQSVSQILKGAAIGLDETINLPAVSPPPTTPPSQPIAPNRTHDDLVIGDERITSKNRYKWVADTGQQIADALAYAHEKNILHRDIKPANLVMDFHGTVWLTDFGLAKNIVDDALTKTGDIIGTPQYMAPESFSGNYDCRSETYCLGLTLYEMATLNPAFQNSSPGRMMKAVTTSTPPAPKKVDSRLPRDLATIIEKAIAREPQSRYQTAAEMRDDLRAFIEDRPIAARRMSVWDNVVRFSRRNPLAAGLAAFSILTLAMLVVTMTIGFIVTRSALNRAESNVDIALEAFDQTFQQYITQGDSVSEGSDAYGFEQIGGIEKAITKEDAQFVEKMLGYYQRLAIDNKFSRDVKTQAATANRLVANVYRLIGQPEQSLASYQEALSEFEDLAEMRARPMDSLDAVLLSVATRNEMASLLTSTGRWQEGLQLFFVSKDQLEKDPRFDDAALKLKWVQTINQITSAHVKVIFGARPASSPSNSQTNNDGFDLNAPLQDGKLPRAPLKTMLSQITQLGRAAVREVDLLKDASPDDHRVRVTRAESYCNRALHENREGNTSSNETLQVAIDELKALKELSPTNPQYQYLLALTQAIAAKDQEELQALSSLKKSQKSIADLTQRFPKMLAYRQLFGSVTTELGGLHVQLQNVPAARTMLALAGDRLLKLKSDMPQDWSARVNGLKLVQHLETLAGQQTANGEVNDAFAIGIQITRLVEELDLQDWDLESR